MPETLLIKQPSMIKNSYLFLDEDKIVGKLEQTGMLKPKIRGEMDGHQWRFVRSGGLKGMEVAVMPLNDGLEGDEILATYRRPALRQIGWLQCSDTEYRFKAGTWKSRYTWTSRSGKDGEESEPLVTFNLGGLLKLSGTVEVADAALQLPDRPMLLVLGLYLSLDVEDVNSVGAVVAS